MLKESCFYDIGCCKTAKYPVTSIYRENRAVADIAFEGDSFNQKKPDPCSTKGCLDGLEMLPLFYQNCSK